MTMFELNNTEKTIARIVAWKCGCDGWSAQAMLADVKLRGPDSSWCEEVMIGCDWVFETIRLAMIPIMETMVRFVNTLDTTITPSLMRIIDESLFFPSYDDHDPGRSPRRTGTNNYGIER